MTSIRTTEKINIQKGFTLIELLIVIVIIGILAGVVMSLINPQQQMRRARQTVFRVSAEKANLAFLACASSTQNATKCDDLTLEVGFSQPSSLPVPVVNPITNVAGGAIIATSEIMLQSSWDTCVFTTHATPSSGLVDMQFSLTPGANCLLE
jgi:prepilin-type N-terminal cleavage/methylation domain-containing protein